MKRIVLTGGPGAGKTVVSAMLARRRPERYVVVPEAATQVYSLLNTTWDQLDLAGRYDAQRRMYRLQVGQEERLGRENPSKILLLDRGTIDGATYWPDGPAAFWADLGTSLEEELARYDAVVSLETCAALGREFYDGNASNFCRFEDAAGAIAAGERLEQLWGRHPRLMRVGAYPKLEDKVNAVEEALRGLNH
jgi:hypothetical protein